MSVNSIQKRSVLQTVQDDYKILWSYSVLRLREDTYVGKKQYS